MQLVGFLFLISSKWTRLHCFENLSGRTYALKGNKKVWAKAIKSGWDKRQATLMFAVLLME